MYRNYVMSRLEPKPNLYQLTVAFCPLVRSSSAFSNSEVELQRLTYGDATVYSSSLFSAQCHEGCVSFGANDLARNPVGYLSETAIQFRWNMNQILLKKAERRGLNNWRIFTFRYHNAYFIYATKLR